MRRWRLVVFTALCFLLMTDGFARGAERADPVLLGHAVDATVQLSIVVRGTVDGKEQIIWYAAGSGTIVSPDGLILTNNHLIAPAGVGDKLAELEMQLASEGKAAELEVESDRFMVAVSDGRHLPEPRYMAWVAASDPELDLAVLRIDSDSDGETIAAETLDLAAATLGDSNSLNLGDAIHVFGFPAIGSGSLTYTTGIVSGFLFEPEIDGTAWINTDAVTSGGNSGGSAFNDAGELVGIPTSGTQLDCRAGDTNRDGSIGPEDIGCLPTGGSLTQLRPIDLARPLLATVNAAVAGEVGTGIAAALTPESDPLAASLAAAEGCAARGDWRCAANFYSDAVRNAPEDDGILDKLYAAYLALGLQEAAAGRIESARSAFSGAIATDPARSDAPAELARIAPYRRAITLDAFDGPKQFVEGTDGESRSSYRDGAFVLDISQPGLVSGFPLTRESLAGENYAVLLTIATAEGDGMVTIETHADPTGGQWVFAVDPEKRTWEVLEYSAADSQFMPLGGPYPLGPEVSGAVQRIELRVTDGFPLLFVNDVDLAAMAGVPLPEIGNQGEIRFGALMSSEGEEPFEVAFASIGLYELG